MSANFIKHESGNFIGGIYVGNVITGNQESQIIPPYEQTYVNGNGATGYVNKFALIEGKEDLGKLLVVTYSDVVPEWLTNNYIGLYNLKEKEWIYQKEEISLNEDAIAGSSLEIYEDKIYLTSGKQLVCHDLYTGRRLWSKQFENVFFISGFIIADNKIIANNEDTYLYALDPDTGKQLWKTKSSGTSSKMAYLDGVVYFVGGGDGLLHAVDTETGKHLWRLRSPDLSENNGAWFKREVMVVPPTNEGEKGKVLTSSYLSAFCYEAAR
jgi:outer membrane protein assembly factor BamB